MSEIVFLLEEPSAEAMLTGFLPKFLPEGFIFRYIVFEGKQDLEKQLVHRMRGYRVPGALFVVLRDQDASDCRTVKNRLVSKCVEAGKRDALVRIACHEIESWYLADLAAVEEALKRKGLARLQDRKPFCLPDSLPAPSRKLSEIAPRYQKVSGSRAIGPCLDPENTRSPSFLNFVRGVKKLCKTAAT